MEFPQYRKKFDNQSFYKITSEDSFLEIQKIGKRYFSYTINAKKYFEKIQIIDMLEVNGPLYKVATEEEYLKEKKAMDVYRRNTYK